MPATAEPRAGTEQPAPRASWSPKGEPNLGALFADEARKGSHLTLPFLLPTTYFVWVVLGDAASHPAVRAFIALLLAIIVTRWTALLVMARPSFLPRADEATRVRVWRVAFVTLAWLTSAAFAATYLAASPWLDLPQIMRLTMIASAVCAVAVLNMAPLLPAYFGYIGIHFGALVVLLLQHPDPRLGGKMPLMAVALVVALVVIAVRTHGMVRDKIVLGLELREAALRDPLTGLRNRHFVTEFLGQASAQVLGDWQKASGRRPVAQKRSFAMLLVDLDHFKTINDTHGHAAGDQVLRAFAKVAREVLRAPDMVARWGGEEFLVVVETRDREALLGIAERLRRKLAAHRTIAPGGAALAVTCSIGACLYPFDPERPGDLTWEETVELADRTLYEAKHAGRDRTLWIRPGSAPSLPREALTATRDRMGAAIGERVVEMVAPELGR
jgi:diguanylate cyclase (GGDEF)-like protein